MHQSNVTELYFENLWAQARNQLAAGKITAAEMKDGQTVPPNYSVTTVARAAVQPNAPLEAIENITSRLHRDLGNQFFYQRDAFHISLLGCTPRLPYNAGFELIRIDRIRECCHQVLRAAGEIRMHLKGVGLVGNQVFIQVFPEDDGWAQLRQRLEDALLAVGEEPLSYANKHPVHMNIMRLTDINDDTLAKTLNTLDALRSADIGLFTVRYIEYAITDFVLSDFTLLEKIAIS